MTTHRSLLVLLAAAALSACEKNGVQEITGPLPTNAAFVRFYNFGVGAPSVNFYANTQKISAATVATCSPIPATPPPTVDPLCFTTGLEPTGGVAFAAAASGGLYSSLAAGQYTLAGKISATTDKDLAIATVATTLVQGKFYTYFMSGNYNTGAKSQDSFLIEDPLPPAFDFTQAYVRFVNAISNSSPMTLYAKSTSNTTLAEITVGAPISYKGADAFTAVPVGTYDLNLRLTGSSTNTITSTAQVFGAGHHYTIVARGDMTVGGTTAATRPLMSTTANR